MQTLVKKTTATPATQVSGLNQAEQSFLAHHTHCPRCQEQKGRIIDISCEGKPARGVTVSLGSQAISDVIKSCEQVDNKNEYKITLLSGEYHLKPKKLFFSCKQVKSRRHEKPSEKVFHVTCPDDPKVGGIILIGIGKYSQHKIHSCDENTRGEYLVKFHLGESDGLLKTFLLKQKH